MIDRRALLRLAAGAGTASLVAACGWDGGNAVRPLLLDVSRFNDWVGEKIFFSKNGRAPEYPLAEPIHRDEDLVTERNSTRLNSSLHRNSYEFSYRQKNDTQ